MDRGFVQSPAEFVSKCFLQAIAQEVGLYVTLKKNPEG